ncbi:MAG: hypothetical protein JWP89_2709 [Schlesneria sp.]|nr:hypothetical protein [Schlesneria sp.]
MQKKKPAGPQPLVSKLIKFPQDWIERIDATRGDLSFSDFVRQAVGDKLGTDGLSQMAKWGGDRLTEK